MTIKTNMGTVDMSEFLSRSSYMLPIDSEKY